MNKGKRKITGVILSLMMVFTMIPSMAFAADMQADPATRTYDPNSPGYLPFNVGYQYYPMPESVTCDGEELEYDVDYEVSGVSPGTMKMQNSWMETLAPGTHKLVFNMDDGNAYKADLVVPEFWKMALKTDPSEDGYFSVDNSIIWSDVYYVEKGSSVELSASGYQGYMLKELKINGQVMDVEDGELFTVAPEADGTIEAVFGSSTSIGLESSSIDFGKAAQGYEQPAPKTVKIKNTGMDFVSLTAPEFTNFTAGELSKETLRPGETAEMTVQPKAGLEKGVYEETVKVCAQKDRPDIMAFSLRDEPEEPRYDAEASLTVSFEVCDAEELLPPEADPDDPSFEGDPAEDAEDATATGDSSSMALILVLMAASMAGAVILIRKRRA